VGFTTAIVQRSRSSFSLCTSRSRADKLEADQHHSRSITRREEEKNREKNFLVSFILEILGAFYRRCLSLPMLSYSIMGTALSPVPPSMSHPHRPDLWCPQAIPDALIRI
jgi:hypothetical protein